LELIFKADKGNQLAVGRNRGRAIGAFALGQLFDRSIGYNIFVNIGVACFNLEVFIAID
jgi:hypothetical protein